MLRSRNGVLLVLAFWFLNAAPGRAYVDLAPTLGRIVRESQTITVAEVERFSAEKGAVLLKKVRDLKGTTGSEPIKQQLKRANESGVDRSILEWAEPGRRGILFVTGKTEIVCLGEGWYQASAAEDGWWKIGPARPDLPLAYYGSISRLTDAIPLMLAGKSATITTLPHGADREGASFDLALNRASLPGLVKVERVRASLRMPDMAFGVGANPNYVLGQGRAGIDDFPRLRDGLHSADAVTRAESAADLGCLGLQAVEAAPDLTKLLNDAAPTVRLTAASALLRIKPDETRAVEVLANGLASADAATRREAARAVGLAGSAAAPLTTGLEKLLNDPDLMTRRDAVQGIAALGPAAAKAREAVTVLLDQHETAIDAADALGRMGPSARPSLKRLARMLSADTAAERWAAVRAMAQIGGPDATPAVQFMIRELPRASEIDGYNMLIYLSLLGPVAKDALPAVRSSHVRNPILRQATVWAIDPATDLPPLGPLGDVEFVQYIFESFVRELPHLQPAAKALAAKILAGKAGNVPDWGYKLLARYPDEVLPLLTPRLTDKDRVQRERATVALGYMGKPAAGARQQLVEALKLAEDERERRLMQWCLREME